MTPIIAQVVTALATNGFPILALKVLVEKPLSDFKLGKEFMRQFTRRPHSIDFQEIKEKNDEIAEWLGLSKQEKRKLLVYGLELFQDRVDYAVEWAEHAKKHRKFEKEMRDWKKR